MERCSVVFSSSTGNTKLLSDAIGEALPKENRDYFGEIPPRCPNPPANLDMLIEIFDRTLSHPDAGDPERLKKTFLK